MIEFAECLGAADYMFVESPQKINTRAEGIKILNKKTEFGRDYRFVMLPRESMYILVRPKQFETKVSDLEGGPKTDFYIKVKHNLRPEVRNIDYHI